MNRTVIAVTLQVIIFTTFFIVVNAQAASASCIPLALTSRTLPAAADTKPYTESVQAFGGVAPIAIMLSAGLLPPGIKLLPNGELSGIPTSPGNYEFTITAVDSCKPMGQNATSVFSVFVNKKGESLIGPEPSVVRKAPLKVTTEANPSKLRLTSGPDFKATIRYKLTAQPAETATMDSPGASFVVEGSVAESIAAPLTAVILNGSGEIEETIKVSKRVLDFAAREKASKIIYSRAFIGRRTTTIAVVELMIGE